MSAHAPGARTRQPGARTRQPGARTRQPAIVDTALALLLALIAAAPLWGPGIINTRGGGDSPFLIQRTLDMAASLRSGIFPVRWMAHAAYDLGYPFFNHYAALPYYLTGGLAALGLNPLTAIQIVQTLGFILAALTMAAWVRIVFRRRAAQLLAVAAYTFAPFHLVNVYVRGDSLSEFYAFVLYPLILWAVHRLARKPSFGRAVVAATAYGALLLTHNVSALIFSPFVALYGLVAALELAPSTLADETVAESTPATHAARIRPMAALGRRAAVGIRGAVLLRLAAIAGALVLGMLLTAWFWLPAIGETGYGQMGPEFTQGYFNYANHFRGLDLIQGALRFDYSVAATAAEAGPFAMGLVQAFLALFGSVMIGSRLLRRDGTTDQRLWITAVVLASGLLATVMITPLSKPLWDTLPLLATTQFPWRFLSVQAVFAAALTGAIAELLPARGPIDDEEAAQSPSPEPAPDGGSRRGPAVAIAAAAAGVVLLAGAALLGLRPERLLIAREDLTWDNLLLYESFTGNIGTTIRYEYLPRDVVPRLYISEAVIDGSGSVLAADGADVNAQLLARTPARQSWSISVGGATTVALPLNWWPGWHASLDGVEIPAAPMTGSGRLAVTVPAGTHELVVSLKPTRLEAVAGVVSLLAGVLVIIALVRGPKLGLLHGLARGGGTLAVCLVAASIGPLALQRGVPGHATFFDFQQQPFPHRGPVMLGDLQLDDAVVSPATAGPGGHVAIDLAWHTLAALNPATGPVTVTVRLVSPAEPRHGVAYTFAETTGEITTSHLSLALPETLARGLYLLQLRVDNRLGQLKPRTQDGHGMGELFIGAVRVPDGPALPADMPVLATFQGLTLHTVEAAQPDPGALDLTLAWSTPGTPVNVSVSYRLLDTEGQQRVQQDMQPGYGYLPTTLWRSDELVVDHVRLPLPEGLAPGPYTLRIVTYLQATMEGMGEVDIPIALDKPTLYDIRNACCEQTRKGATILCQADNVALLSLQMLNTAAAGGTLAAQAEWNALQYPKDDLQATWRLVAGDGSTVISTTAPLAPGGPTTAWPRFTWVLGQVGLTLPPRLAEGTYRLALSLSGPASGTVDCGQVAEVAVAALPRAFEAPALPEPQRADFGDTLSLLGYDVAQDRRAGTLALTLWWRAQQAPARDLKRFVHLYDPATEQIAAQSDAMPRDWAYPTSWWAAGEVVSETVTLDVNAVPAGSYRLGVGWYDPETLKRLPVTNDAPDAVRDDRLTLETPVRIR